MAILRWIWPADRCTNCHSIYSISKGGGDYYHNSSGSSAGVTHIHRAADGRFVLANGINSHGSEGIDMMDGDGTAPLASTARASLSAGSDDGGFLSKQTWAAWRLRQMCRQSTAAATASATAAATSLGYASDHDTVDSPTLRTSSSTQTVPVDIHQRPSHQHSHHQRQHHHHNHLHQQQHQQQQFHTPSRVSRIIASSPTASSLTGGIGGGGLDVTTGSTPWSPINITSAMQYFSDLSSVQPPTASFADHSSHRTSMLRSMSTHDDSNNGMHQLRYLQERYSQELPSLRAIHEETRRMAQGFVPLHAAQHQTLQQHPQQQAPHFSTNGAATWRYSQPTASGRASRSRLLLPRHARMARSAPDLGSPGSHRQQQIRQQQQMHDLRLHDFHLHHNNHHHHRSQNAIAHHPHQPHRSSYHQLLSLAPTITLDTSPESRSSSSGFGSKNTSTQHNQSSQSGSTHAGHPHHHNQHHADWRYLPPYRPPPPPPVLYQNIPFVRHKHAAAAHPLFEVAPNSQPFRDHPSPRHLQHSQQPQSLPDLMHLRSNAAAAAASAAADVDRQQQQSMSQWLDLIARMNSAIGGATSAAASLAGPQMAVVASARAPESVDVGSVDGHYEFDQVTLTPTASTPTGLRDDQLLNNMLGDASSSSPSSSHPYYYQQQHHHQHYHSAAAQQYHSLPTMMPFTGGSTNDEMLAQPNQSSAGPKKIARLPSRYEHIEARVQAMKEEFYAYRKRQAAGGMNNSGGTAELESAC